MKQDVFQQMCDEMHGLGTQRSSATALPLHSMRWVTWSAQDRHWASEFTLRLWRLGCLCHFNPSESGKGKSIQGQTPFNSTNTLNSSWQFVTTWLLSICVREKAWLDSELQWCGQCTSCLETQHCYAQQQGISVIFSHWLHFLSVIGGKTGVDRARCETGVGYSSKRALRWRILYHLCLA